MEKPLSEETDHQYLDLNVGRNEEFGQKAAIKLPDASTRSFAVDVTEIDFADNSVWTPSGAAWERSFELWGDLTDRKTVSAGGAHTVGLRADGSVIAVGSNFYGQCDVADWADIKLP